MLMVNFLIDERKGPPKNVCNLCSGNVNARSPEFRINPQLSVLFLTFCPQNSTYKQTVKEDIKPAQENG